VTLRDAPTHPTLPCQDLARARAFYSEKLGLEPSTESPAGMFYETGGTRFFLSASSGHPSGTHTQMGFRVDDVEGSVRELEGRGVEFEVYDFPAFDKATKVATTPLARSAWFKDSEGNLIGIVQLPEE
jgi:catechol 2,3-dioxygenase-like lactoylglutathione lyase family enzyme